MGWAVEFISQLEVAGGSVLGIVMVHGRGNSRVVRLAWWGEG
jgi:hypothetical protein